MIAHQSMQQAAPRRKIIKQSSFGSSFYMVHATLLPIPHVLIPELDRIWAMMQVFQGK